MLRADETLSGEAVSGTSTEEGTDSLATVAEHVDDDDPESWSVSPAGRNLT